MSRFERVYYAGIYAIDWDKYNDYYMVMKKANGFYQQIGKPYYRMCNAIRLIDKLLGE